MTEPSISLPPEIDTERPSISRTYDYFLGGNHNFEADRELARKIHAMTPAIGETARANRSFLRRVVQHLVATGIDQFLDIGSGIPTVGNVHEVAQDDNPHARVVYVDIDPFAVAYSRHILAGNLNASALEGDVRDIDSLLTHPEVHRQLDFTRPIAVLVLSILHFIPDENDPAGITARIAAAVPSGSYLAITHATHDGQPPEVVEAQRWGGRAVTEGTTFRTHAQISALFHGFELVDPGVVHLSYWKPDDPEHIDDRPELKLAYAGLGRKL